MAALATVFMGTADFAVPSLRQLAASPDVRLVGVVTQPDRPVGRGRALQPSPVKAAALALGLPVLQPERVRRAPALAELRALVPDLIVVAAYGQILPQALLDLPRLGCLNVHGSLLPRHRGASPVAAAILAGDASTGVTIMQMDAGLDTGAILSQMAMPVEPEDTTGSLTESLARLGATALLDALPLWRDGALTTRPQDDAHATYAPLLQKEMGRADWRLPAVSLWRQCRAYNPWPALSTDWAGRNIRLVQVRPISGQAECGRVVRAPGSPRDLAVGTGDRLLQLERVQLAGRREVSGREFLQGQPAILGARLGAGGETDAGGEGE